MSRCRPGPGSTLPLLRRTKGQLPNDVKGQSRPIDDVCAMSAFQPIATKLLHDGK